MATKHSKVQQVFSFDEVLEALDNGFFDEDPEIKLIIDSLEPEV